jgi:hypothetical protein
MRYILAIYHPGDHSTLIRTISADEPFMAIQVGDLIGPSSWGYDEGPQDELVVTKIKHGFSRYHEPYHQMMVFTRLSEDAERTSQ